MSKLNVSLLLGLCIVGSGCAAATDEPNQGDVGLDTQALEKGRLLALGDSIAFGYNPFGDFTKDKNFSGYPEALGASFSVKNSSCPGETSGSFLSNAAPDNGCRGYKANNPLHVTYGEGVVTQMDYALARITSAEPEDVPTQITLNLSGNDIFLKQAECRTQADPVTCFSSGAGALIGSIATNVGTILGTIRGAGYTGPITYMNLYATDYSVPSTLQFLGALNATVANVARSAGAKVANAYGAFQTAAGAQSPCAAGLLIPNPAGGCDVHPSAAGAAVLAQSVRDAQ